jgi:hypothetical protein
MDPQPLDVFGDGELGYGRWTEAGRVSAAPGYLDIPSGGDSRANSSAADPRPGAEDVGYFDRNNSTISSDYLNLAGDAHQAGSSSSGYLHVGQARRGPSRVSPFSPALPEQWSSHSATPAPYVVDHAALPASRWSARAGDAFWAHAPAPRLRPESTSPLRPTSDRWFTEPTAGGVGGGLGDSAWGESSFAIEKSLLGQFSPARPQSQSPVDELRWALGGGW